MNCPACDRNLALTLSVCPSCGTMVHDSVREELALKILPIAKPIKKIVEERLALEKPVELPKINLTAEPVKPAPPIEVQISLPSLPIEEEEICLPTREIAPKATSPILVEFQSKNAVIPEWRLQLQNSIRRRNGGGQTESVQTVPQRVLVTNGSIALKAEPVEQPVTVPVSGNATLENALRRIEQSRQKYLVEEKPFVFDTPSQPKTFPSSVPARPQTFPISKVQDAEKVKPKTPFAFSMPNPEKFDTNKLKPLSAEIITAFENPIEISSDESETENKKSNILQIKAAENPDVTAYAEATIDEFVEENIEETAEAETDDRAPMMMRFNAGFFDLIIGAAISFILLAPFTLTNGNLFTFQGLLAFLATCSIVMFIYLTATIGTMGRTFGMKIFSLEIVDIEENAYPTFHQAAVSSSVYLVSLALGGIGFLTLFLNDENRAAHDLISGTIVVKECE